MTGFSKKEFFEVMTLLAIAIIIIVRSSLIVDALLHYELINLLPTQHNVVDTKVQPSKYS